MMGAAQEKWFMEGFSQSRQRWNIIGQQTVLSSLDSDPGPAELYSMDSWDGYPVARARLTDFLSTRARLNPIVLAGDAHGNWVFDVKGDFHDEKSPIVATEFVGTSISSGRDGADQNANAARAMSVNPHCKFSNARRGYVRCDLTPSLWTTDFRTVPYIEAQGAPIQTAATFVVESGTPGAVRS
jgi:alkaline phosphatase D